MTIIAIYDHYGCKAIVADTLITGPRSQNGKRSIIPTLGDISDFFGDDWGIQPPAQKIFLIGDYCAIAWAGKMIVAQYFMARIRRLSRRIRITKNILERMLKKSDEKSAVSIVAALIENGKLIHFGIECETISNACLGDVFYAGTGGEAIRDYDKIVKSFNISKPTMLDVPAQAVAICLTQVAHLMHAEARQGDASNSLRDCFGGGYEIAVFYGGEVHKISASFIFLEFEIVDGYIEISHPFMIINQGYEGEILIFETIKLNFEGKIEAHHKIQVSDLFNNKGSSLGEIRGGQNWACFVFLEKNQLKDKGSMISTIIKSEDIPFSFHTNRSEICYFYSKGAEAHIKDFLLSNV